MQILYRIRVNKSKRILRLKFSSKVIQWIERRRNRHKNAVLNILENWFISDLMLKFMDNWKAKVNNS